MSAHSPKSKINTPIQKFWQKTEKALYQFYNQHRPGLPVTAGERGLSMALTDNHIRITGNKIYNLSSGKTLITSNLAVTVTKSMY